MMRISPLNIRDLEIWILAILQFHGGFKSLKVLRNETIETHGKSYHQSSSAENIQYVNHGTVLKNCKQCDFTTNSKSQ